MNRIKFQKEIWDYYKIHGRKLPWRNIRDPYKIFVSEVMLQQTQVARVLKKYPEFIEKFPTFQSLADAQLSDVLLVWQGMGYNRRAKFMKHAAEMVMRDFGGVLPGDQKTLKTLPGVGSGTAGSLIAFVYNKPVCFIETNIRRVIIHFFFKNESGITEREILEKVEKTIDRSNPREWYYAVMDYGSMLPKKERENANKRSVIYKKQTPFLGSRRRIRGMVMNFLLKRKKATLQEIGHSCNVSNKEIEEILSLLCKEKLIKRVGVFYSVF